MDEPPPLEEAPGLLSAAAAATGMGVTEDVTALIPEDFEAPAPDGTGDDDEGPTLLEQMMAASSAAVKKKRAKQEEERKKEDASFGAGLKSSSVKKAFAAGVLAADTGAVDPAAAGSASTGVGAGAGAGADAAGRAGSGRSSSRVVRKDKALEAALLRACHKGDLAAVEKAIVAGVDTNAVAPTKSGQTPLALAAFGGHKKIVKLLLDSGADPNGTTKKGRTALMVAASAGDEELVLLLLHAGAKAVLKDKTGKSARQLAKSKGRAAVERRLAECEAKEQEEEEVITLKARDKEAKEADSGLRLPEVQSAMKNQMPQIQKTLQNTQEWMTPDFIMKMSKNPVIARGLANPRFVAAISEFQTNPQAANAKYKNDPAVTEFLTAFMSVMGDHFTELGAKQEQQTAAAAPPVPETPEERAKRMAEIAPDEEVKGALSNPKVLEYLEDPKIKMVLQDAAKPGRLAYWLSDPEVGPKLHDMRRLGLIQFQ